MRGFKSILFVVSALFCLLLANAQGAEHQQQLPPGAFFAFNFPGYSSLHDCSFFDSEETPLSAKACIELLQKEKQLAENDVEYAKSGFFITFIGKFGPNPLLYAKVNMLFCKGNCRELKPHRSSPPEMMWRPPEIINKKNHLMYPLPHSVPRENLRLSLTLADGEWRSNLFAGDFWSHNYMNVRFNHAQKTLIVERDWIKTLRDSANYFSLWQNVTILAMNGRPD
ncbi:MAG: hypothetical protein R8K53_07535 [Mariprofundaceae bacterium]